jgi:hypothetical protein
VSEIRIDKKRIAMGVQWSDISVFKQCRRGFRKIFVEHFFKRKYCYKKNIYFRLRVTYIIIIFFLRSTNNSREFEIWQAYND